MGDAGHQRAQGFHLLGLEESILDFSLGRHVTANAAHRPDRFFFEKRIEHHQVVPGALARRHFVPERDRLTGFIDRGKFLPV